MENKEHTDKIKRSIENIIGIGTTLRSKKPTEENINKDKFEKMILALESIEVKNTLLYNELGIDLFKYNEPFYIAIDNLLELHFSKDIVSLIDFYIYERMNPDGSLNVLIDENNNEIVLESPSDLWNLIRHIQKTKSKK